MIHPLIFQALEDPAFDIEPLFEEDAVIHVDWRENDDEIVAGVEAVIQSGSLTAVWVDADHDADRVLQLGYGERQSSVPLVYGTEDRHITIVAINEILDPDYEIRFCIDSDGSDTLVFLPLSSREWSELEDRFDSNVEERFYQILPEPNLFTDSLSF